MITEKSDLDNRRYKKRNLLNSYTELMVKLIGISIAIFCLSTIEAGKIYVLGDSHCREFINIKNCYPKHLGPVTMHRVGRDGLQCLDIRTYGVEENDVAIFCFGEIDVRCHIGKECFLKNRKIDEVIFTLAHAYFHTIYENRQFYKKLICIIYSVTPPTNVVFNSSFPYFGELIDRVNYTKQLNAVLAELCQSYEFMFLDVYDYYANPDGTLNIELSDGNVHINKDMPIQEKLFMLLEGKI